MNLPVTTPFADRAGTEITPGTRSNLVKLETRVELSVVLD